jgi:lysophospholipase L1-like esterase
MGGLVTWHRPSGLDVGAETWLDEGDGNDLAAFTANPCLDGIPIDGHATLDASNQSALKQALSSLTQPWTTYVVTRARTFVATVLLHDGHTSTNRCTLFSSGTADPTALTSNAGSSLAAAGGWRWNTVHAVRVTANGASSEIYVTDLTGTPVASGAMGAGTWAGLTLGSANTGSSAWRGDIAEMLRYSGAHDAAAVEAYLIAKYPSIAKRAWTAQSLLCLGDSITLGLESTDGRGYRPYLREAFETADVEPGVRTLRFMGPTADAAMDHAGVSGDTIAEVDARAAAAISGSSPEVLVLLAGTNDCRDNGTTYDSVTTPAAYADLLATIFAADNALPVVVCLVPPLLNGTHDANVDDLNAELVATVIPGADSTITVCDLNSILNAGTHLADGVHPNDAGYALIADAIEAAIRTALA